MNKGIKPTAQLRKALRELDKVLDAIYLNQLPDIYNMLIDYKEAHKSELNQMYADQAIEHVANEISDQLITEWSKAYDQVKKLVESRLQNNQAFAEWAVNELENRARKTFSEVDKLLQAL